MGKHARMFRNVMSNLGNEVLNSFEAEAQRDFISTKQLAATEIKNFNMQSNNLDNAYKNFGEVKNYMIENPNMFPLSDEQGNRENAVDKTLSMLFSNEQNLFEGAYIDVQGKLKKRFLSPIVTKSEDPYIPAATFYDKKKSDIRNKIGQISKINKTTNLLTTMGEFSNELKFEEGDYKTSIATSFITANAYGIMGKSPSTQLGRDLLQIDQISIIANNAYNITDKEAKSTFIKSKLQENGINLERLYLLENPLQAKVLAEAFQTELRGLSQTLEGARTRYNSALAGGNSGQISQTLEEFKKAQNDLLTATNKYSGQIAKNYLGKFDFGPVDQPVESLQPMIETMKEITQKMEEKIPNENQFKYNGKIYDIPPRFKGQKLTVTLKKALAAQQDNVQDATP